MPRHRNKKQNSFKCYIRNQTDDSADIYFYGDIVGNDGDKWWGNDDKCPSDVATLLKECENVSQLNIYVNSNGGDVFAGNAIYNMLKRHKAHKTVYVDGLAASIASVIVMAGDEIIMPANSYLTWLSAKDAAELFPRIQEDENIDVAACISSITYNNIPKNVIVKNDDEDDEEEDPKPKKTDEDDEEEDPKPKKTDEDDEEDNPDEEEQKEKNSNELDMLDNFVFMEGAIENEQEDA